MCFTLNFYFLAVISCLLFISGCQGNDTASINLTGYNYTNAPIAAFQVNGQSGSNVYPNSGGGSFVCCIVVPKKWNEGMNVKVRWTENDRDETAWKEKIVLVPPYQKQDIAFFAVHFYPDNSIKVLVTRRMSGHPDYPYPSP